MTERERQATAREKAMRERDEGKRAMEGHAEWSACENRTDERQWIFVALSNPPLELQLPVTAMVL